MHPLGPRPSGNSFAAGPTPDVEVVGVGDPALGRGSLAEACIEAARAVWDAQGGPPGTLVVGLVSGVDGGVGATGRPTLGAYCPSGQTVLLFLDTLARAPSPVRRLLRVLAHEVTHAVQHVREPGLRGGGPGSVLLDAREYRADPLEREAAEAADAFDLALRRRDVPPRLLHLVARLEASAPTGGTGMRARRVSRWTLDQDEAQLLGRLAGHAAATGGTIAASQWPRALRKAVAVRLREIRADALWDALATRTAAGPVRLRDPDVAHPLRETVRDTLERAMADLTAELAAGAAGPDPRDMGRAHDLVAFYDGLARRLPALTAARRAVAMACRRAGVLS